MRPTRPELRTRQRGGRRTPQRPAHPRQGGRSRRRKPEEAVRVPAAVRQERGEELTVRLPATVRQEREEEVICPPASRCLRDPENEAAEEEVVRPRGAGHLELEEESLGAPAAGHWDPEEEAAKEEVRQEREEEAVAPP